MSFILVLLAFDVQVFIFISKQFVVAFRIGKKKGSFNNKFILMSDIQI